jgi:ABC-type transport system substrate-binding protein
MKKNIRIIALLLVLVMLVLTAACGGTKTTASDEVNITIGIYLDTTVITPFDPSKLYAAGGDGIIQFLYDSLYFVNAKNEYESRIIESEEWTDDTHLTVKLKDGSTSQTGHS